MNLLDAPDELNASLPVHLTIWVILVLQAYGKVLLAA